MESTDTPPKTTSINTPWWYWIVVALALLFSLMGLAQLSFLSESPDPLWTKVAYAIGQLANFAGAVSLVFRRRIARWLYLMMGAAFTTQRVWLLVFSGLWSELPSGTPYVQMVVIVISLALFVFSSVGLRREWLR